MCELERGARRDISETLYTKRVFRLAGCLVLQIFYGKHSLPEYKLPVRINDNLQVLTEDLRLGSDLHASVQPQGLHIVK